MMTHTNRNVERTRLVLSTKGSETDDPGARAATTQRRPDAERTRQDILAVARQEFAEHGLSGARVDAIAARMSTTKRMIYYYFGSKQGLYLAVLENAYGSIRALEQTLDLDRLSPPDAVRKIVGFTFDYHDAHPEFVRLVSIENIHQARNIAKSTALRNVNSTIIDTLETILQRGRDAGLFRPDIMAVDLHMMMSAPCFYRVSNRHTFAALFNLDFKAPENRDRHRSLVTDAIMALLTATIPLTGSGAASALRPEQVR